MPTTDRRYAIKKMRRKFKGVKAGAKQKQVDWKKYGKEAKKAAAQGHKAKHKSKSKGAKSKASGGHFPSGAKGGGGADHKRKKTH
jgi:hypothetical protein